MISNCRSYQICQQYQTADDIKLINNIKLQIISDCEQYQIIHNIKLQMKDFFRLLFCFWIHTWDYLLFQLSLFTFIQQFLSQIELWQNLQLNESSDQSMHFFWIADKTSNIHLTHAWVCYLMSYLSKAEAVCYYMCCDFSCSFILTDREFYIWHSCLIQECCEFNSVCFYLNDHCALYFVRNCMLLDHSMFWFSDF